MSEQTSGKERKSVIRYPVGQISSRMRHLIGLLALVLILVACGPPVPVPERISVETALPKPTLEPTFTPSPPPTAILRPLATPTIAKPTPTSTPVEPIPTPTSQTILSGRILDQDTDQPVAGAKVSAGTNTAATDADGHYALTGLPPGQYILSVIHPDYDPGLSSIITLAVGQEHSLDLSLYDPDSSPYPKDPMLTNPLDPEGAPTAEDAERLARVQGLTGEVVAIRETKLSGEYLVNYKIGDQVRAAVAEINHDVWELTDDAGRLWRIIKVCGNLSSTLPPEAPVATPAPRDMARSAQVAVDGLIVRECTAEECAEVRTVERGTWIEVIGCTADGAWCQVDLPGRGRGWCNGKWLRYLPDTLSMVEPPLPAPKPAEGKIAFISTQHSPNTDIWQAPTDIYVMNPDGSEQRRLRVALDMHVPIRYFQYLVWFSQKELVFGAAGANYIFDLESNRLNSWDVPYSIFDISESGQAIGYIMLHQYHDIFVANRDGSNPVKVTETAIRTHIFGQDSGTYGFAISPDGEEIVFGGGGADESIGVINTDGSGARVLVTVDGLGLNDHFDWSPDGHKIVFESVVSAFGPGPTGVLTVNADGSDLRLLFESRDMSMPVWSPDSQKIAFVHENQIWVMDADGRNVTQLTNSGFNCCPAWSQ